MSRRFCETWEAAPRARGSGLRALPLRFPGVLRIFSGLRKIRVRILQHRVLIAVPELLLHPNIPGNIVVFGLNRTLRRILVEMILWHDFSLLR